MSLSFKIEQYKKSRVLARGPSRTFSHPFQHHRLNANTVHIQCLTRIQESPSSKKHIKESKVGHGLGLVTVVLAA